MKTKFPISIRALIVCGALWSSTLWAAPMWYKHSMTSEVLRCKIVAYHREQEDMGQKFHRLAQISAGNGIFGERNQFNRDPQIQREFQALDYKITLETKDIIGTFFSGSRADMVWDNNQCSKYQSMALKHL